MTFNIPLELRLISTDVQYRVPTYSESTFYAEDTEVRKGDEIYNAISTRKEAIVAVLARDFAFDKYTPPLSITKYEGNYYEKLNDLISPYFRPGNARPIQYEFHTITGWDFGATSSSYFRAADGGIDEINISYTFTEDEEKKTSEYRVYEMKAHDNTDDTDMYTKTITVCTSLKYYVPGRFAVISGNLTEILGQPLDYPLNTEVWEIRPDMSNVTVSVEQKGHTTKLTYLRPSIKKQPFDTKQYTSVVQPVTQTWKIKSLKKFNGVALGMLRGSEVRVTFRDPANNIVDIVIKVINGKIDENITDEAISEVIYASKFIDANGTIEITITGESTEIGFIFPSASIDVGLTNLEFSHDVKNFDRNKVSAISGYTDHIKGNRVIQHKGSFDIKMIAYDKMVLLNKKLTQELIAIDGSDTRGNEVSDGKGIFASTKMICRVVRLSMKSTVKNGDISATTPIDFDFEEVV